MPLASRGGSWGVAASVVLAIGWGCSDSPSPRKTPTVVGGEAGEWGACNDDCAGEPAAIAGSGGAPASEAEGGDSGAAVAGATNEAGSPPSLGAIELSAISIYQTLELPLMQAGESVALAQRPAPLIAGKRALVRAFVELAGFADRPLLGVLDVKNGQRSQAFVSELSPSKSSLRDDLGSTFTFEVAGSDLELGASYRVRLLEADTTPVTQFPNTGYAELAARALPPFELVLVPMTVNGFAPRLGEVEVGALRSRLLALFPSPGVELSVGEPLVVGHTFSVDGEGWIEALDDLLAHRAQAHAAPRVFYYGVLAPAASYSAYCSGSCVLGLATVTEPDASYDRGAIGVGVFQDGSGSEDAGDTMVHELGHALGREHADCGEPDYPDPFYPYDDGGLGSVYGFDFARMRLVRPRQHRDIMSYCVPAWISDYTYRAVFERLSYIEREAFRVLALTPAVEFRVARIDRFGRSSWRGRRSARAGGARPIVVPLLDVQHTAVAHVTGRLSRFDHLPGGSVWLPLEDLSAAGAHFVDLRALGGSLLPL